MILLSSHYDKVKSEGELSFCNNKHIGLLDNIITIIASYIVLYSNQSLKTMLCDDRIKIFHSLTEEFGSFDLPSVNKKDIVLVLDVCDYNEKKVDIVIENPFNFSSKEIKEMVEFIDFEEINYHLNKKLKEDDEACVYAKQGCKVISLCIPVSGNFHRTSEVDLNTMNGYCEALKRIICYFA